MRSRVCMWLLVACAWAALAGGCGSSGDKQESASAARVQVTSPADGSAVRSDRITVRGTVTPPEANVLVLGQPAQVGNGVFTIAVPVHRGQNTIDVVASAKGVTPASTKIVVTRTSPTGTKKSTRTDSGKRSETGPVFAGARNCGSGVTAGANTSCPFAQNVVEAYAATGSGVLDVRSPVTGQTYRMYCTGGTVHVCTGGNNASVYFGNTGAYTLGNCGGDLSAGPNTSCGFAENVRAAYRSSGASVVSAFSPATGRTYTMYCTTSSPHVCTGGNDAAVYFP
jgi:Glucodextranase, domain B